MRDLLFDHLRSLTTEHGVFEHCLGRTPRVEHGFCADDAARALIAVCRSQHQLTDELHEVADVCLALLEQASLGGGRFRNRRAADGSWLDEGESDDAMGRTVWALGTAMSLSQHRGIAARATELFADAVAFRSPWPRATAFAAVGAAQAMQHPTLAGAAAGLLRDAARSLPRARTAPEWPWPEERLTYANAILPEALITVGCALGRTDLRHEGLLMLRWLLARETSPNGWLSTTAAGGHGLGDPRPAFDQQPIEAATLADACAAALGLTGDKLFADGVARCAGWFLGENDLGVTMFDVGSGAAFDGLTMEGPNTNCGAESAIAFITTMQHADRLASPFVTQWGAGRGGSAVREGLR
jgi:hypothetical protein